MCHDSRGEGGDKLSSSSLQLSHTHSVYIVMCVVVYPTRDLLCVFRDEDWTAGGVEESPLDL